MWPNAQSSQKKAPIISASLKKTGKGSHKKVEFGSGTKLFFLGDQNKPANFNDASSANADQRNLDQMWSSTGLFRRRSEQQKEEKRKQEEEKEELLSRSPFFDTQGLGASGAKAIEPEQKEEGKEQEGEGNGNGRGESVGVSGVVVGGSERRIMPSHVIEDERDVEAREKEEEEKELKSRIVKVEVEVEEEKQVGQQQAAEQQNSQKKLLIVPRPSDDNSNITPGIETDIGAFKLTFLQQLEQGEAQHDQQNQNQKPQTTNNNDSLDQKHKLEPKPKHAMLEEPSSSCPPLVQPKATPKTATALANKARRASLKAKAKPDKSPDNQHNFKAKKMPDFSRPEVKKIIKATVVAREPDFALSRRLGASKKANASKDKNRKKEEEEEKKKKKDEKSASRSLSRQPPKKTVAVAPKFQLDQRKGSKSQEPQAPKKDAKIGGDRKVERKAAPKAQMNLKDSSFTK